MTSRTFLLALLCALTLATAIAPPPASAQDAARKQARALFDRGVERFARGEYAEALAAFEKAYAFRPHPVVRLNLGSCHEKLGDLVSALHEYELFLEETDDHASDKAKEATETVARLRRGVGTLEVSVSPPNAVVRVDGGEPLDLASSRPLYVTPGPHQAEATFDGYPAVQRAFTATAGATTRLVLRLDAEDGAEDVVAAQEVPSDPEAEATDDGGGLFTPRVLVAGGVTLGLVAGAVVTGVMALSAKGDFDDAAAKTDDASLSLDEREAAFRDGEDASDRAGTLSLVSDLLAAGAVIGAGVMVYFVLTEEDEGERAPERAKLHVAPVLGPTGAGATLAGTF